MKYRNDLCCSLDNSTSSCPKNNQSLELCSNEGHLRLVFTGIRIKGEVIRGLKTLSENQKSVW